MLIEIKSEPWCSPDCINFELEERQMHFPDGAVRTCFNCAHEAICKNAVAMYRKSNGGQL